MSALNRTTWKDIAAGLLLMAVFGLCGLFFWRLASPAFWNPHTAWRAEQFSNILPEELGEVRMVYFDISPDLVESILSFGLAREFCGGALLEISDKVAERISVQGLDILADAEYGRGYPPGSDRHASSLLEPWRETPLPKDWFSEGALSPGFGCMKLGRDLRSAITRDARETGSYYSRIQEGELLVIPKRRLVVVTFWR